MARRISKVDVKQIRAMQRLVAGALIYDTGAGWSFGGNKYVPERVVRRLPLELAYTNNRGWAAYRLDPKFTS
jgi:hypothetical protein